MRNCLIKLTAIVLAVWTGLFLLSVVGEGHGADAKGRYDA